MRVTDEMVEAALAAYVRARGTYEREVPADSDDIRAALEAALSHAAGQEVVDCVRSSELWCAIDEAKNPADFLARAIAILQRSNMAMVDNTAVLEPAVARSEGEGE